MLLDELEQPWVDVAFCAVERDGIAFVEPMRTDLHRAFTQIDGEIGTVDEADDPQLAGDDRGV